LQQVEHQPVMLEQVLSILQPRSRGQYLDLTVGLGGHAESILERSSPRGRLLGIDRDAAALDYARRRLRRFGERARLVQGRFSELEEHLRAAGMDRVDGLLADLGVSSLQLQDASRGFSLQLDGPLDMRMDQRQGRSLEQLLRGIDGEELARLLGEYGDVRQPRRVSRRILEELAAGRLRGTLDLARVGAEGRAGRLHPATRVFQALRMLVNQELEELRALLQALPEPLRPGGRAVIISFHSAEDRLVKNRFADLAGRCRCPPHLPECRCGARARVRLLNRRARRPSPAEVAANPRARSARLRALERLAA